jgi:hypothetical protein
MPALSTAGRIVSIVTDIVTEMPWIVVGPYIASNALRMNELYA